MSFLGPSWCWVVRPDTIDFVKPRWNALGKYILAVATVAVCPLVVWAAIGHGKLATFGLVGILALAIAIPTRALAEAAQTKNRPKRARFSRDSRSRAITTKVAIAHLAYIKIAMRLIPVATTDTAAARTSSSTATSSLLTVLRSVG